MAVEIRTKQPFKLQGAATFARWEGLLQDYMWEKFHNTDMSLITTIDTIDFKYFRKTEVQNEMKLTYKEVAKRTDASDKTVDPRSQADFVQECIAIAFKTGRGFEEWVYGVYAHVRKTLGDAIQDQTAGVNRGDLVGLLQAIKIAVHHVEISDPDDLEIEWTSCTMEREGKQDLMTFLAVQANYNLSAGLRPLASP